MFGIGYKTATEDELPTVQCRTYRLVAESRRTVCTSLDPGEAEVILARSEATARGIRMVREPFNTEGNTETASLRIVEQYTRAFSELAKNRVVFVARMLDELEGILEMVGLQPSSLEVWSSTERSDPERETAGLSQAWNRQAAYEKTKRKEQSSNHRKWLPLPSRLFLSSLKERLKDSAKGYNG